MTRVHELKTLPEFFRGIRSGAKTFEVRKNDRGYGGFAVGDKLDLREFNNSPDADNAYGYTGRRALRTVTYILSGEEWGIMPGYVVMGLGLPEEESC